MTPKEQVIAAYRHELKEGVPSLFAIQHVVDPNGYRERPPFHATGLDWFGVPWLHDPNTKTCAPDHSRPPVLNEISEWKNKIIWPDLETWDWSKVTELDRLERLDRENCAINVFCVNGPFERLHMLMGFENALCALIEAPDEVEEFLDVFMEWKLKLLEKIIIHYQPDIVNFHDDWGTQTSLFFDVDTWKRLFAPQIKKAVDLCHEYGVFYEQHSCGKVELLVPYFPELGIDSWQGQEINDIPKLKELTKGQLLFHTIPLEQKYTVAYNTGTMTEEEIRKDIRERFILNAQGGNYYPLTMRSKNKVLQIMFDEVSSLCEEYS